MEKWVGLIGFLGLLGLIGIRHRMPAGTPGMPLRLCGLLGFIGLMAFWTPPLGASGAFGALSLWNHPKEKYARLAWLGFAGIIGPLVWWFTRA